MTKPAPKSWERLRCGEALLDSGGLTERGLDECYGALPHHKHGGVAATGPGNARHDGVPGVISGNFSVRETATKSLLSARHDYI